VVEVDQGGVAHIWAAQKAPLLLARYLREGLGLEREQLDIHLMPLGGDFGGKGSFMDIPLAYFLARASGRAVKMAMSYVDELTAANPRHAATIVVRSGVDGDGRLLARWVRGYFASGGYAAFKPSTETTLPGFRRGALGPYAVPTFRAECHMVYTNSVPCGHMRSPGEAQVAYAIEAHTDLVAREIGIDPIAFRRLNANLHVRPADETESPGARREVDAAGAGSVVPAARDPLVTSATGKASTSSASGGTTSAGGGEAAASIASGSAGGGEAAASIASGSAGGGEASVSSASGSAGGCEASVSSAGGGDTSVSTTSGGTTSAGGGEAAASIASGDRSEKTGGASTPAGPGGDAAVDQAGEASAAGVPSRAVEVLEAAAEAIGWRDPRPPGVGRGVALLEFSTSPGIYAGSLRVARDGQVTIQTPIVEQGAGMLTVFRRIVAEELGVPPQQVGIEQSLEGIEDDRGVGGSRTTRLVGKLLIELSRRVQVRLAELVAAEFGASTVEVHLHPGGFRIASSNRVVGFDEAAALLDETLSESLVFHATERDRSAVFLAQAAEVSVDRETGAVRPLRIVTVQEVGRIVDPLLARRQIEGAVLQGLGYAVMEQLVLADGRVVNQNLHEYKLPTQVDTPVVETIMVVHDRRLGLTPIGEGGVAGVAPAIVNAVAEVVGPQAFDLPLSPEKVLGVSPRMGQMARVPGL
jgi:CO/xanthine dehydrogenase Mo-binding subunit